MEKQRTLTNIKSLAKVLTDIAPDCIRLVVQGLSYGFYTYRPLIGGKKDVLGLRNQVYESQFSYKSVGQGYKVPFLEVCILPEYH